MGIALTRPSWMDETQLVIYRGSPIVLWILYRGAGCVITPVAKELLFFNESYVSSLRPHHITSARHNPYNHIEEKRTRNRECPQTRLKENLSCPLLLSGPEHGRYVCYMHEVPAGKRKRLVQFPGDPEVYILRDVVPVHKHFNTLTEHEHQTAGNEGIFSISSTEANYITDLADSTSGDCLSMNSVSSGQMLEPEYSLVTIYSCETLASASEIILNRDEERVKPVTIKGETKVIQESPRRSTQTNLNERKVQFATPKSVARLKKEIPHAKVDDVVRAMSANNMDQLMEVPFNKLPYRCTFNY